MLRIENISRYFRPQPRKNSKSTKPTRTVAPVLIAAAALLSAVVFSVSVESSGWLRKALVNTSSGDTKNARKPEVTAVTSNPNLSTPSNSALTSPFAPTVTATKTDELFTDVDNDTQADPGDTLKYSVVISASGEDATGVTFTDTVDANTAFVAGTLMTTPLARADSYSASGNIRITVAAPGVLANDSDPDGVGPALNVNAGTFLSAQGGNVSLNADGSFTYNPAAGFEGADSFTYTLNDGEGPSDTGTVSITVSGMIWFIDNTASCPCDGRLTNPFNTLASFQAINDGGNSGLHPAAGDNIFVYESASDYVGPVTLLSNQKFIGQDATDTLSNISGVNPPAGSDPLPATNSGNGTIVNITSATSGINLGLNNTLRGFTGGNAAPDINGSGFGTAAISDITLNGDGQALSLTNGTLSPTATFASISSNISTTTGISLTSVSGALTSGSTTISDPTGIGISVDTSSGTFGFANTSVTGSGNTGVSLTTNTGAITFGDLDISPDAGQRGLLATDNSNTITSTSGTIATSVAAAVEITHASSTTPLVMSLTSVSTTNGPNGIVLLNTTGSFTVNGDGSSARNGTGGTITGVTNDAVALTNATNVTLRSMNLTNNGDTAPATLADAENTTGDQTVQISGGSGVVLSGVLIQNPTGSGYVALNLSGTNRIDNNSLFTDFADGTRHGIFVNNVNTNMALFEFKDSTMNNSLNDASMFLFENTGTSNMTLDVKGSTFENLDVQALTISPGGTAATTGTLTATVGGPNAADRNFFQNAHSFTVSGVTLSAENNVAVVCSQGATGNVTVENNLFDNIAENGQVANTSIIRTQNAGGKLTATVKNNVIQNINYATGALGRHVIGHIFEPLAFNAGDFSNITIEGNTATNVTYTGTNREFVFMDYRVPASGGDVKIINNNWNMPTSGPQQAIELRFRQSNASTVNLQVADNIATHNTTGVYLDVDAEAAANVNTTITNNNFTNSSTPVFDISVATEAAASTMCANISGNTLTGANSIEVNELAGTLNVTQASSAALSAANGGAAVTVGGSPTFGAAACTLPLGPVSLSSTTSSLSAESLRADVRTALDKSQATLWASSENSAQQNVVKLTQSEASAMLEAAIARWAEAGLSARSLAKLQSLQVEVADLPAGQLATANSSKIVLDETASGYGWFFDTTPSDDNEFEVPVPNKELQTTETSTANGRIDLLTVVMRQLGSQLNQGKSGLSGPRASLMESTLGTGTRRAPALKLRETGKRLAPKSTDAILATHKPTTAPRPTTSYQQVALNGRRNARATTYRHHPMLTPRVAALAAATPSFADVMLSIGVLPAGKSITITWNVTVDNPFPGPGSTVCNQGTVSGTNFSDVLTDDPDVGGATDPTCTPIDLNADLAVDKSGPATVAAGDNITYTISVTNNGPDGAVSLSLSDAVPANTTFVSVTTPAGWTRTDAVPSGGTGTITFTAASLAASATSNFTLVVNANPGTLDGTIITNTVNVSSTTADPVPSNNSDSVNTTVQNNADLSISKTRVPNTASIMAGTNVTYTILVTNNGPSTANSVTFSDPVPAGTTVLTQTNPAGWSCNSLVGTNGTITCTKSSMANGETATLTVEVMVGCNVPDNTIISNTATVSAASPADNNLANNQSTASFTVNNPAPVVTASVTTSMLPQNTHDLINVGLSATANDGPCGPLTVTVQVFGDEEDETPTKHNELFSPDAKDIAVGTLRLRAERVDSGDGRVYLIVVKSTDAAGQTGFATVTVVVPKSSSAANIASVNEQAAAAKAFADANNGTPPAGYFVIGDGPIIGNKQ